MMKVQKMPSAAAGRTTVLDPYYVFRDRSEVIRFIQEHPFLVPLLQEAIEPIRKHLPGSPIFLQVVADPEVVNGRELVVSVATDLPPGDALQALDRFDNEWWLAALDRAEGKLCVKLEFR